MEPKRLRLEGATLPELQARMVAEHGDGARIIAAEQVTVGGIRGFFAKRHIEVTVELPADDPADALVAVPAGRGRAAHARDELSTRLGIAALLDEADDAESRLHDDRAPWPTGGTVPTGAVPTGAVPTGAVPTGAVPSGPAPAVPAPDSARRRARDALAAPDVASTGTPDFARLMDELTFATSPARAARAVALSVPEPAHWDAVAPTDAAAAAPQDAPELTPGAPRILDGPGDLVLLIGLHTDVLEAARLLSSGPTAPIFDGPDHAVTDRRSALAARARGVERGRGMIVVQGVPARPDAHPAGTQHAQTVTALGADQVWAVVHAGRKPSDTARWVRDAGADVTIDAVAVLGVDSTATPGTVRELGLPIGWLAPPPRPPASAGPPDPFAIG
ncbi:hypothetical protein E3O42_07665 [Cryobacterium adonitolivorans]|uniref:Uncharacterized protein n=1 Tax=Cryobacterium adonitolivorans TaxID=1259189 RepID=A0A4R8W8G3_9MICO|nr:hypothetical protein [Cryobacterium adonitolivorans]TFC02798.1 hypothetical protein E3O42_07665 [Cryobacterium adonitolivorans]